MKQLIYLISLLNVHGMATDDVAVHSILGRVHISNVITILLNVLQRKTVLILHHTKECSPDPDLRPCFRGSALRPHALQRLETDLP
jgi:hypothetical protein